MPNGDSTRSLGERTESEALAYLRDAGLTLVARNHRCRFGEIDLIMRDDDILVFVEVRLRRNTRYGSGAASVTHAKQRRLILAARHYLSRIPARKLPRCRFDVVSVSTPNYASFAVEWIRNAFTDEG